jgi:hypothetical protein
MSYLRPENIFLRLLKKAQQFICLSVVENVYFSFLLTPPPKKIAKIHSYQKQQGSVYKGKSPPSGGEGVSTFVILEKNMKKGKM